jgi:hypothetical protein
MFGPWITVVMLALESSEVIGLRVAKLAQGGVDAQTEAHLLVNEKIVAVFDTSLRIVCGATTGHVIDRFREQVAANFCRTSARAFRPKGLVRIPVNPKVVDPFAGAQLRV